MAAHGGQGEGQAQAVALALAQAGLGEEEGSARRQREREGKKGMKKNGSSERAPRLRNNGAPAPPRHRGVLAMTYLEEHSQHKFR